MQKILKNEKGAISLFILLTVLFFLIVVTSVGIFLMNKETQIDKQYEKIKTKYEKNAEQVYEEAITRNVTFDANGGTVDIPSKKVKIGRTYGELPIPTREGYTFKGWNGKNMFDEETLLMAIPDATYVDGYYVFTNLKAYYKYGRNGNSLPINFKDNTQYTFSVYGYIEGNNVYGLQFGLKYLDENVSDSKLYFNQNNEEKRVLTSTIGQTINRAWLSYGVSNTVHITHIQLEEGPEATEFEPYYVTSSTKVTQNKDHTLKAIWKENKTVEFNANGGTVSENTRTVETGTKIGTLPIPTKKDNYFDGWFTLAEGGTEINVNTIITDNITYYAHWSEITYTARANGKYYNTLQAAVNSAPTDNTETIIRLGTNITENITIAANKNITLDLQNYTISTADSGKQIIVNNGTLRISNGIISQTGGQAAVNNAATGKLYISGGRIESTGERAAVYNFGGGTIEISGNPQFSSNASGIVTSNNMERGTVQNLANGKIIIKGGTIEGTNGLAISNKGILTLGEKQDGNISNTSPIVIGKASYGLKTSGTFNFYDGIIKGISDAISGSISDQEPNTQIINGTETIDGQTYKTVHLESQ